MDTTPHIGGDKGKPAAMMAPSGALFPAGTVRSNLSDPTIPGGDVGSSSVEESSYEQSAPFLTINGFWAAWRTGKGAGRGALLFRSRIIPINLVF